MYLLNSMLTLESRSYSFETLDGKLGFTFKKKQFYQFFSEGSDQSRNVYKNERCSSYEKIEINLVQHHQNGDI